MKNIHINDSYKIWSTGKMRQIIYSYVEDPMEDMDRTFAGMCVEWYLHNICYYVTLPFGFIPIIKKINVRCKDVDLESHYGKVD